MSERPEGVGKEVLYEKSGAHIAVIRLNRPEKKNAVNGALAEAMGYIVRETEGDPDIRVVVLASSTEGIFSAGADLGEVARGNGRALFPKNGGFAGIVESVRHKPWIAAIDGPALAGGCEIALSCDMIVASEVSSFGLPEVKRGLFAAAGGVQRLPRALPRNVALQMIATGEPLDAARAYALGLVNRLVDPDRVLDTALQMATTIAANAPVSVVESLKLARVASEHSEAQMREKAAAAGRIVLKTEDSREGPRAFVEKRAPVWKAR
jgi:enoyl-CoA hydratase